MSDDHVPTLQEVQLDAFAPDHVPAQQEMQAELEEAVIIVLQVPGLHEVQDEEPLNAHAPVPQFVHTDATDAPTTADALPASQFWHVKLDTALATLDHVPALQLLHETPPSR